MATDLLFARLAIIAGCIIAAIVLAFALWQLGESWFWRM